MSIRAGIWYEHDDLGEDTYHEWILTDERIKADELGRPNARMYEAKWIKAKCNNSTCFAAAAINIGDVLTAALGETP